MISVSRFLAIPTLALSLTFGASSVVLADEAKLPSAVWELVAAPMMKIAQGIEERVTTIESSLTAFATSFTSQRIATRQLCVVDESGAETCISKAQLDSLLR